MKIYQALTVVALVIGTTAATVAGFALKDVGSLRSQVSSSQRQLSAARARLAQVDAQAQGLHRDLLTCQDFAQFLNGYTTQNAGNYIGLNQYMTANGSGYTVPLPDHCINR